MSRFLLLVAVATALAACTRPPDLVGIDNPEIPAASVPDVTRHKVFIMTTRQASEVTGALFSAERAPELGLASVDVTIPPTHVPGALERPTELPPDPRTEFTVVSPSVYASDEAFIREINRELAKRPPGQRELMLFVHGYNNTTSDAILRLAQFVEDTDFNGIPVLFTWASAANASRYVYDLNSALVARGQVKHLSDILGRTNASSVNIFAHSMGSLLVMEGLVDAQLSGRLGQKKRIDNLLLAAPDIDLDLFRTQVALLPPWLLERTYIFVSEDDSALRFSRRIAGGVPRVGAADAEELGTFGVTVIDLSEIEDSTSGSHSKFAGSPEVVQLIGVGLNSTSRFGDVATPSLNEILSGAPIRIFGN
jgi:esterase/lipase superfamily enzyme